MPNGSETPGISKKQGTRRKKRLSAEEKKFAELMVYEKMGCIQAARLAFGWACEPKSSTATKAQNLSKTDRVVKYKFQLAQKLNQEVTAQQVLANTTEIEFDTLRQFIYRRLVAIRDDENAAGSSRFKAIAALEKMVDPAADVNLILMWVDLMWRAAEAHCPCCHSDYPLRDVRNVRLERFRDDVGLEPPTAADSILDRRMTILGRVDPRRQPHPGQIKALEAPERNIAGLGAARAGKSSLLAMFAVLAFLIPGVEIWILARIYADANKEVEYLDKYLNTLFFPYTKHIITRRWDSKTEELTLESKWGSSLKVKSAKAKGSITGSELELALIAEPGWVPDDVYNHLRARMTSRLGRTVLLGTPQGFGGILGRFTTLMGKDEKGRPRRIPTEERTIAAGCPWNISLYKYSMTPEENPEYVSSELDAARQELTEAEFATEFQGKQATAEGALFHQINDRHLTEIPRSFYEECAWVVGIDQGPKNFAACLLGYDGKRVVTANEYFDNDARTMDVKMDIIRELAPNWIRRAGGDPSRWVLTIFDVDPPVINELNRFDEESRPWPTDFTFRIKDKKGRWNQENWRKETYEYINTLAQAVPANLYFDAVNCDYLHDQMTRAQVRHEQGGKGWVIQDALRADHVVDAFVMAMFTILSQQLVVPDRKFETDDPWTDAKKAFEYRLRVAENKELSGAAGRKNPDEQFREVFGRGRSNANPLTPKPRWNYKDY